MRIIYTKVLFSTLLILGKYTLIAQVGINTQNPTATLEVVSETTNMTGNVFKTTNSANQNLLNVNTSGDLIFGKALMPDQKSGNIGEYLTSQGANTPPVWVATLPEKSTMQIFNAQRDANSTIINQPTTFATISMPLVNSSISSVYGTWNSSNNTFVVSKNGVYTITAGYNSYNVSCANIPNSIDWEPYATAIYLMVNDDLSAANLATTLTYNNSYSHYLTKSMTLGPQSTIRIMGASNSCSWAQGPSYINILYSEIP